MNHSYQQIQNYQSINIEKSKRIVIVGGGPAGVHFASLLSKRGFTDITVLEQYPKVGGKSATILDEKGIPSEIGTCYLNDAYDEIRQLIREYDPENKEISISDRHVNLSQVLGTDGVPARSDNDIINGEDLNAWFLDEIRRNGSGIGCSSCLPSKIENLSLIWAGIKYIALHYKLFGKYDYGMPPPPKNFESINMTAIEFLKKHKLMALEGFLRFGQQLQGYGILENIPAFYLLWWVHPKVFIKNILKILSGAKVHGVVMLSKGYQSLWESIYQKHKENVKFIFNATVTEITRGLGTEKPKITYTSNGALKHMDFDQLVMAINLNTGISLIKDLTTEETEIFTGYKEVVMSATLIESDPLPYERPIELWFKRMVPDEQRDGTGVVGRLNALRNSYLALYGEFVDGKWKVEGRQRRVAFQYIDRMLKPEDRENLKLQLLKDLELIGAKNTNIITHRPYHYFPRYENHNVSKLWRIKEIQGLNNTLWIGSSVCFESVLDVVVYNIQLNRRIFQ